MSDVKASCRLSVARLEFLETELTNLSKRMRTQEQLCMKLLLAITPDSKEEVFREVDPKLVTNVQHLVKKRTSKRKAKADMEV